jgi:hypothetical protein
MKNIFESLSAVIYTDDQIMEVELAVIHALQSVGVIDDKLERIKRLPALVKNLYPQILALAGTSSLQTAIDKSWPNCFTAESSEIFRTGPHSKKLIGELDRTAKAIHELTLFNTATIVLAHQLKKVRAEIYAYRKPYRNRNNGLYPLLDLEGRIMQLKICINTDDFLINSVQSFIDPKLSLLQRQKLYAKNIIAKRLALHDLKDPRESILIGQMGVFAVSNIPENTCLGVYGGTFLRQDDYIFLPDQRYCFHVPGADHEKYVIDGINILSLINSKFRYDESGNITGHAEDKCMNVHTRYVPCIGPNNLELSIPVMFAKRAICEGEELRMNYGYDMATIARVIQ